MQYKSFPKAVDKLSKDTWYEISVPSGETVTMFMCSNGHIGSLSDHFIHADGVVTPSVVCPSCDFHEWIKLEGYTVES